MTGLALSRRMTKLAALLVIVASLISCQVKTTDLGPSPSSAPTLGVTPYSPTGEKNEGRVAQAGDPVDVGDLAFVIVGWKSIFHMSSAQYLTLIDIILVNQGDEPRFIDPSEQISLSSDRGGPYLMGPSADSLGLGPSPNGVLLPGERVRGTLVRPDARWGEELLLRFSPGGSGGQTGVVQLRPGPTRSHAPARLEGESAPALHAVAEAIRQGDLELTVVSVSLLPEWMDWTDWEPTVAVELAIYNRGGEPAEGPDRSYLQDLDTGERKSCLWREEGQTRVAPVTAGYVLSGDEVRAQVLCREQAVSKSFALAVEGVAPEPWKILVDLSELVLPSVETIIPQPTPSPSRTLAPTPVPPWYTHELTDQHPTEANVNAYLGEDVADMHFEDVSGDGQIDLVVSSEIW